MFRVLESDLQSNYVNGSGDRIEFRVRLGWNGAEIVDSVAQAEHEIGVAVPSANAGGYPLGTGSSMPRYDEATFSRANQTGLLEAHGKWPLVKQAEKQCGFDVFSPDHDRQNRKSRKGFLSNQGIYTRIDNGERLIVACNSVNYCKVEKPLLPWTSIHVSFNHRMLCTSDLAVKAAGIWLRNRIVRETVAR